MADKKSKTKSTRRKLGEAFTEAIVDSAMDGGVGEAVQRIEAAKSAAAAKGSRKRGKTSERAPAAPGRAKKAKGTLGKAKASHGKAKAPGRVVAIGLDVPRLDEVMAADRAPEKPDGYEFGRPTDYRPEYAAVARALCKRGATAGELAEEFGVSTSTIWLWRCKYEDFSSALLEGKDAFDDRAERALAMRAIGYSVHTQKLFCYEGSIVRADVVEHYPPDVGALKMWLGNRRPDKWKDKQEVKLDSDGAFLKLWSAISDGTIDNQLPAS